MSKWFCGYLLITESKGTNLIITCQQVLSEHRWPLVARCGYQSETCKAPKRRQKILTVSFFLLSHFQQSHAESFTPQTTGCLLQEVIPDHSSKHRTPILSTKFLHLFIHSSISTLMSNDCVPGSVLKIRNWVKHNSFPLGAHSTVWKTDTKIGLW